MGLNLSNLLIYEDDSVIVINKPSGVLCIPDGYQPDLPNLRTFLEQEYGKIWVVHRLDRETSGIALFARTAQAHRNLNLQFENRLVKKIYHALIIGVPDWQTISIELSLRINADRKHRTRVDLLKGKPAVTEIRVLEVFNDYSLTEVFPRTGYTHQIRSHLSALDFPIAGDTLYTFPTMVTNNHEFTRLALHAKVLNFTHPDTNIRLKFETPYPDDFAGWLIALEKSIK